MNNHPILKIAVAGLASLALGSAYAGAYFMTKINVATKSPVGPAISIRALDGPIVLLVVRNASDHSVRCRLDFSTGGVPWGTSIDRIPARGSHIERSPVPGPVGAINVAAACV